MTDRLAYQLKSDKPYDEVVANLERLSPEHQFRVLAVHNVQETLAEKGFERGPLKIIEICNAGFAHQATQKDINVALFMPCRFTVYTDDNQTVVTLARPSVIAEMLPEAGLNELAATVEETLKTVMTEAV
ncbi:MAG: DUF302 domain-containing protein [candidate division Zixibacteria bacterium]|nr:DUF302 domain-containing protein [candidate division Zixibacteria bacterium]MDH3937661.1 DUF302 domain-containing protein [candidate division Zixibacteria bacterium]MDH4034219.1 DUF302 domain-containing protein [candidate division Zixibacteria bacterium]